ncbi:MAG: hypothetical protein WAW06_12290 [bacterium]
MNPSSVVFLTLVRDDQGVRLTSLLIDSLRAFGGALRACPVWLFDASSGTAGARYRETPGVRVLPLIVPEQIEHYPFAAKVYACARAEDHAGDAGVRSLVWIDSSCLVVRPPVLFELGRGFDAAVRPVHIKNVGLRASEAVDGYWQKVFESVGVHDVATTVESFVDAERVRAYFNTHAFSVNAGHGLLREWFDCFRRLVVDRDFQAGPCSDKLRKIFLHQAVLSALVAASLDPDRVRILPPEYNYPYHLHQSVPAARRARSLNDLVCVAFEDDPPDPGGAGGLEVREPLKTWLAARLGSMPDGNGGGGAGEGGSGRGRGGGQDDAA